MHFDFGIDFGTTNSACVGILNKRKLLKFADTYDGNPFPSLVIIDTVTARVYTGREAWHKRQEYSEHCEVITSVKSYLGTDKIWNIAGKTWTPEMVATEIFKGLQEQVASSSGPGEIREAVVAIPVGFSATKRQSLRKAAAAAGTHIKSFISEPTAAFFRHFQQIGSFNKVGVIDWGGGTLDVSILENSGGLIKELATGGLTLGGDNIDLKLAHWVHNQVIRNKSINISFKEMPSSARDMLLARCEKAKKDFTIRDIVDINLNRYGSFGPFRKSMDVDTFSRLIENEVDQAIGCFEGTLKNAGISIDELGCVLMVGGSVSLRPFMEKVLEIWPCEIVFSEDTDWSVARGAGSLSVQQGNYILAETVGLIMADDSFYPLLQDSEIVSDREKEFSFALVEDSTTANFIFAEQNRRILGYMHVPSFGFLREKVSLKVSIDKNLILRVIARSTHRSERYLETWSYPALKLYYQLPDKLEVTDDEY